MADEFHPGDSRSRLAGRRRQIRARLLAVAVVPVSLAMFAPNASAAKNVSFVGSWKGSAGNFTITKENRKTGVCAGRSSFVGYKLIDCKVRGHSYSFTITLGSSYKSRNTGTIHGNSLKGTFKDSNGTVQTYTATRRH